MLDAVHLRRGGKPVLEALTLTVRERRVGLAGRNGSGKSSLGRLVKGLLKPDSGTVRVHGLDPARRDRDSIAAVGFLFQNSDHQILCPTVGEEIAFGLVETGTPRPEAETRTRALLAAHGVEAWFDRPVVAFSEGQRRLICLLAVLVLAPKVVILDEPYAGLDIPTRLRLARFIAGLDCQVVLIGHDADCFAGFDRLLWLEEGRVAADGAPERVLPAFLEAMHRLGAAEEDPAWT